MPIATDTGSIINGNPVNDAYGTVTAAFDTEFTRVIAPRASTRAKVSAIAYECGTTVHTLSMLVCIWETLVASDAASGQTVIALDELDTNIDGSVVAAADWFIGQYEDGSWAAFKVASVSALNVTMSANLGKKVLANSKIYFMGAPADHPDRQFRMPASTKLILQGADMRVVLATANKNQEPILVHSNNITAQGWLLWTAMTYGEP